MVKEPEEKELTAEGGAGSPDAASEAQDATSTLKAELDQVRTERDQLLDRLARLQAEFENSRRRETKERADLRDYAVQNAVEPFLGVMDNFQLALKADGSKEQLRAGVELILKQMEEALKGLQVQPKWSRSARSSIPASTRRWAASKPRSIPTTRCWRRFAAATRYATSCCGLHLVRIAENSAQKSE